MTVENPNVKNTYAGNGSTTVFPFTFQLNPEDVNNVFVTLSNEEGTEIETTDFLLSLSDKSVRYPKRGTPPLAHGWKITIHRQLPYTQTLNLMSQGPFFAEDIEGQFDRQEMQIQQLAEAVDRCVKGSISGGKPPNVKIIEKHIHGGGGSGLLSFGTIAELLNNGVKGLSEGTEFKTLGYYRPFDGGGANYLVRYLWSASAYPWAIDIGATEETEYELVYQKDGTPETDANGAYILKTDAQGRPIPLYEADGHTPKKKHLYAVIAESVVNYRQFGAKLDGATDDGNAISLCHKYQKETYTIEPLTARKHYTVRVENHEGIIRKDNNDPIMCCGNIDLSGSKLLIKDDNATWFGFYLWGDNEEDYFTFEPLKETTDSFRKDNFVIKTAGNYSSLHPNALLALREDPYAVRDDGGYLYSEPRYELLLHTMDGLLTSPLTYDWNNPGGLEISSTVSDYNSHAVTTQTVNSHFKCSYTMLPATHYHFVGCDVEIQTTANKYCSVLWCKCHNAHIRGFNFRPDSTQMHNTRFKNTMIYLWGAYNVEVSDIVGFNAAGKKKGSKNGTSGYVLRVTNCLNVHLHDISVQGYWGATAMNCVKDVHVTRVSINRLDIHNYFYNLYIDQCNLFNHAIQIGEGRGIVQITNSNFYINKLEADSYPNAHLLEFNLTYGRIFEGRVLIEGCNVYLKDPDGKQFDVCKIDFTPEAVSTLDSYRFPDVTIRDCHFYSYNPDTYLVYFMVAGKRNCKTSTKGPSVMEGMSRDLGNDAKGTLSWRYVGRGIDWNSGEVPDGAELDVVPGQYVRTYKKFLDTGGKTAFFDFRYYLVTQAGRLPVPTAGNTPTDESGAEFPLGTAKVCYAKRHRWEAARSYAVGDACFTEASPWLPVYCYVCTAAGTSNGWRPTHTAGKVIEGEDVYPKNLDACYWQYVKSADAFVTKTFVPRMEVVAGDVLYADHRLYQVLASGTLTEVPPLHTGWLGSFREGTARLSFIGKDWKSVTWWAKGAYCLSYDAAGTPQIYQLVDQDGTTSGEIPVPGNGRCVDGDMIWQHTQEAATKEWKPQTQFFEGDVVSHDGNHYRCVFDGRLELPSQINIENITTNIKGSGDVFAFWEGGTDIPTKVGPTGQWKITVDNADCCRFRTFANGYFGHAGNPAPTITITTSGASGTSGYTKGETDALLRDKANVNHGHHLPAPEIADNTRFLRNDGTYQKVTPTAIGAYTKGETDALIGGKAPLASPALTGKPTTPTAAKGTNDAQIASTAFVAQAVATLVNSAPETLDTLQELARALNNDPNFATTMLNLLAGKVNKNGDTMSGGLTFAPNTVGLCGYVNNDQDYWRLWGRNSHPEVALDLRSYGGRKSSMFFRRFIDDEITEWVYLIDDDGNARFPKDLRAFSIYSNDWFRVNESNRGIYWEKHRGGWYMRDDEWIRVWNGKGVYTSGKIRCDAGFEGDLRGTADNASKLGNMTLAELLAEVDRRIAAKHP